jgi:hypothetical protein
MSPTHQTFASEAKCIERQAFCELIAELIGRLNAFNLNRFDYETHYGIPMCFVLGVNLGMWDDMRSCSDSASKSFGMRVTCDGWRRLENDGHDLLQDFSNWNKILH